MAASCSQSRSVRPSMAGSSTNSSSDLHKLCTTVCLNKPLINTSRYSEHVDALVRCAAVHTSADKRPRVLFCVLGRSHSTTIVLKKPDSRTSPDCLPFAVEERGGGLWSLWFTKSRHTYILWVMLIKGASTLQERHRYYCGTSRTSFKGISRHKLREWHDEPPLSIFTPKRPQV